MSALVQLKLPPELQALVKAFVYYSKEETLQRIRKRRAISQLNRCTRVYSKLPVFDPFFDVFYFKQEKYDYYLYDEFLYIEYYHTIISAVFCKECHNYVSNTNYLPRCIECECVPELYE